MKKELNNVPKLKSENGTLSGGFASLDVSKMNKIKGGRKETNSSNCSANCQCSNTADCSTPN